MYIMFDIDTLIDGADEKNYIRVSKNFLTNQFDVEYILNLNGEYITKSELLEIQQMIPIYYKTFKAIMKRFEDYLLPNQMKSCIDKLNLRSFDLENYLQAVTELTVLDFCLREGDKSFVYEPRYNGKKNPECSFVYKGKTVNIEVKCPNYQKRISEEKKGFIKVVIGERLENYPKTFTEKSLGSDVAVQKRMDNKMKDFLISAHKKFPDSNENNFNILVICLDIIHDLDEWYNYLFETKGGFSGTPFFSEDISNVDAVLLSNIKAGHIRWIKFPLNAWKLEDAFNLLLLNPSKEKENINYYCDIMHLFGNLTESFLCYLEILDEKSKIDFQCYPCDEYFLQHNVFKTYIVSNFCDWLKAKSS